MIETTGSHFSIKKKELIIDNHIIIIIIIIILIRLPCPRSLTVIKYKKILNVIPSSDLRKTNCAPKNQLFFFLLLLMWVSGSACVHLD
jgi:hypothetical protein